MAITKVSICGSKRNYIKFEDATVDEFGLVEAKVGFREVADPTKADEQLALIQANLDKFKLGVKVVTKDKLLGEITGIAYEVVRA